MTTITDRIGSELAGRYRLEAGLGTGASAHVYLATDLRLRRQVAVKLLHAGLRGDAAFLRRFGAEAQSVAALHHPNILQVFDWGEEPEPYIVLEHCAGGSLRDLLDSGARLSVAQAAAVGAAAARGLAYAHRRGLIHRDVKPANLLFDEEGGVRIADFGLARALAEASWTEPVGAVLGTARYASPEQAEGRQLDERSDVYSLALVCFEAVTGKVPFSRETTVATLMARIGGLLPPAPELGPLAPILAQAAISEPLARLDADELAVNLEMLSRTLEVPEQLPLAPRVFSAPAPVPPPASMSAQPPPQVRPAPADEWIEPSHPMGLAELGGGGASELSWLVPEGVDGLEMGEDEGELDDEGWTPRRARRPRRPRRAGGHRRWPLRAGLAIVLLVLLGAGGAAVDLLVLHRQVPPLDGASMVTARAEVDQAGLRLVVAGRRYSVTVPAGEVLGMSPAPGRRVARGSAVRVVLSSGAPFEAVPAVAGQPVATAEAAVRGAHLVPAVQEVYSPTVPTGRVVGSSPSSGALRYGSKVTMAVSKGPAPVTIPAFGPGTTWTSAEGALRGLRLVPVESLQYATSVPAGDVLALSPAEGTAGVKVGTTVGVAVSKGPRLVAVPDVAGDPIAQAVAALRAAGLVVTEQIGPPFATKATTTLPAPGAEERPGTSVTLYVV